MIVSRKIKRIREIYAEYPRQFWVLNGALFIDRLGGALVYPFLTLYITKKFAIGMTEIGALFGLYSLANLGGSLIGGALTDRLGRKGMLMFGLIASALATLAMGLVGSFELFAVTALFMGLFAETSGPAQQAMVADLLPEEKRSQGFGIMRVMANLAIAIGPAIGGLLATTSYLHLFMADVVLSFITALVVRRNIRETKPAPREGDAKEDLAQTFRGYWTALHDSTFVLFIAVSILVWAMYLQMNLSLGVYLRDVHGISERGFGYLLSLNAAMVVLLQFTVTRSTGKYGPLIMMATGTTLSAIGFGLYGIVSSYALFLTAMVILTVGEMIVSPISQALVARLSPEHMRGRYMAVFGFSWIIPGTAVPFLAGLIIDRADPRWIWYATGLTGFIAASGFVLLHSRREPRLRTAPGLMGESVPALREEARGQSTD